MKKPVTILFIFLLALSLEAVDFPSYDFTFFKTSDETLTSLTKEDVGIDITGYGFIGTQSKNGIYMRIGIQTPFDTLLKLKDELFSSTRTTTTDSSVPGEEKTTNNPSQTETTAPETVTGTTTIIDTETVADTAYSEDQSSEGSSILNGDTTTIAAEEKSTTNKTIDTTKWKFLFSLGPAYRSTMGKNALVYGGIGFCLSTEIINSFAPTSNTYNSSFSTMFSLDLDAGFRVGLIYSKTTIRIGVHSITHLLGYEETRTYIKDGDPVETRKFYCYIAGKNGLISATVLRGYIRLATTFTEKETKAYNYSNKTSVVGNGVLIIADEL